MRISEQGQITIPKHLRDRFGMNPNVEVEIAPTEQGLLIRKQAAGKHPVERVAYGGNSLMKCAGDRRRTCHRADTLLTRDNCFYAWRNSGT